MTVFRLPILGWVEDIIRTRTALNDQHLLIKTASRDDTVYIFMVSLLDLPVDSVQT